MLSYSSWCTSCLSILLIMKLFKFLTIIILIPFKTENNLITWNCHINMIFFLGATFDEVLDLTGLKVYSASYSNIFNSQAVGMDSWVHSALKSILRGDPIFESSAWFFVIILKFIFTSIFEIKIHEKNSLIPKKFHFRRPIFNKHHIITKVIYNSNKTAWFFVTTSVQWFCSTMTTVLLTWNALRG